MSAAPQLFVKPTRKVSLVIRNPNTAEVILSMNARSVAFEPRVAISAPVNDIKGTLSNPFDLPVSPTSIQPLSSQPQSPNQAQGQAPDHQQPQPLNQPQSLSQYQRQRSVSAATTSPTVNDFLYSDFKVDVYAKSYVPQFLKNINTFAAHPIHSVPPPCTNFEAYVRSFAGADFLEPFPTKPPAARPIQPNASIEMLTVNPLCYQGYFMTLLGAELYAVIEDYRRYEMYNVTIELQNEDLNLYKLYVPGIREDNPPVKEGDMVSLRQLVFNPLQLMSEGTVTFTGVANLVYIVGINRARGFVVLRCGNLIRQSMRFNVVFGVSEVFGSHIKALVDIQADLNQNQNGFMRRMLFPNEADGIMQTKLPPGSFARSFFDKNLNYEQQKAIDAIVNQKYGSIPYLISGPPGTGKTKTVCETALQILASANGHGQHILLCAPSDEAADTVALRLSAHFNPTELLRLQRNTRSFTSIPDSLMQYCCMDSSHGIDMFGLPVWQNLMAFKIVVCNATDAAMLVEARMTNRDLHKLQTEIWGSFTGKSKADLAMELPLHWTGLLFDEAAQGTEPETIIPLTVIMPPAGYTSTMPFFALAGDQKQLGPRLVSRIMNLERSLLERLFEMPLYANHPLSRRNLITRSGHKYEPKLPYSSPPFTNLLRNYRSHPAILSVPSAIFYHDTLITEAENVKSMTAWEGWRGKGWPVMFVKNGGLDEEADEGSSFYNLREISKVRDLVLSLVDSGLIQPKEIAVMAPFREQVRKLRYKLRETRSDLRDVNVGPLEAYQGAEHRFVIICTTRTRERFLKQDIENGLGIIHESKRLTVASTRAKEGVIFIGNPWLLQKDPSWLAIISFCMRHGLMMDDDQITEYEAMSASKLGRAQKIRITNELTRLKKGEELPAELIQGIEEPNHDPNLVANVNVYKLSESEQIAPQNVGRIEQALIYSENLELRHETRGSLSYSGNDTDDAMYIAAAAAEMALQEQYDFEQIESIY